MIKASNNDKDKVLHFLKRNPSGNGFFIGDLENFSLEEDFLDLWYEEREGEIIALLLRYYKSYLVSSEENPNFGEMVRVIVSDPLRERISGMEDSILGLAKYMDLGKIRKTNLAVLSGENFSDPTRGEEEPVRCGVDGIEELFMFLKGIEEFEVSENQRASFGKEIKTDTGRAYVIRREGRIVSCAQISAENSLNGTVMGVATDAGWRCKGLARLCVSRACRDMIDDGKEVILFYDNPLAGKLYKDLGFTDRGCWIMCRL